MASNRKRARSGPTLDLDRVRDALPAIAMVVVVAGILVLTAVLQVDGDLPERTESRDGQPLPAIPADGSDPSDAREEAGVDEDATPMVETPAPVAPDPATVPTDAEARARDDLARIARARGGWTLQLGVMCDADNVRTRMDGLGSEVELYFLPFDRDGRVCYRVCWGVYGTREAADAATPSAAVRAVFTDRPVVKDVSLVAP